MKVEIPVRYLITGGLSAVAIFSLVFFGFHAPSVSENPSLQTSDIKLLEIYNSIPTQTGKNLFLIQSKNLTESVDPELADLDSQIISCSANVDGLLTSSPNMGGSCVGPKVSLSSTDGKFLGGQCCGAMKDMTKYHEHLEKLKQYSNIPDIPLNPYKTPIDVAKKWIDYDRKMILNSSEQAVFNQAMKISDEGPCCCKCWHYYVNEGIAKKLIHDYGYDANQVADFWNVSDICGI